MDKMEDAKYLDLMAKYLSGNLTEPERVDLFAWVEHNEANRKFFDEMIQLWSISSEYEEEEAFDTNTDEAWNRLDDRLFGEEDEAENQPSGGASSGNIVPLSKRGRWYRYAAVILLLIAAGTWFWIDPLGWRMTTIATADGEKLEVELPDGSQVWLNEETTLTYRKSFRRREVHLTGEAFFDVERMESHPFSIVSGDARTVVLGTSFNVRAYPDEDYVEVTVRSGQVSLQNREEPEEEVLLKAGSSAVFLRPSQEVRQVESDVKNADAWKTRELRFQDTPLREVIETVKRYYDLEVEVTNEAIYNCRSFSVNAPFPNPELDSILVLLRGFYDNLTIDQEKNKLIFSGPGCE